MFINSSYLPHKLVNIAENFFDTVTSSFVSNKFITNNNEVYILWIYINLNEATNTNKNTPRGVDEFSQHEKYGNAANFHSASNRETLQSFQISPPSHCRMLNRELEGRNFTTKLFKLIRFLLVTTQKIITQSSFSQ